ncbi:MAG: hypothetical protein ACFFFT_08410 [Candidatus Thorarchaeota archaeon]
MKSQLVLSLNVLSDEEFYNKIIELEMKFNNDPSNIGLSSHK